MAIATLKPNQHQIFQGDIFYGIISNILDNETFCIVKAESTVVISDIQDYATNNELTKMFWYPSVNEKFLIYIDGYAQRVKRVPLTEPDKKDVDFMQLYLIDTGETCLFPIKSQDIITNDFLMIPQEFLDIPPLAHTCKWIENGQEDVKMLEFLKRKILTLEAIKIKGDIAYIKIHHYEHQLNAEIIKKFGEALKLELQSNMSEVDNIKNEPKLENYHSTDNYECIKREDYIIKKESTGILPKKYYDIKITFIVNLGQIIFRFIDPNYEQKFEDIEKNINKFNNIWKYKKVKSIPKVGEFVLAKVSGVFKRAKVIDHFDDSCVIWILDEGSLEGARMTSLYDWDVNLNEPKFLTDEMEIFNVLAIYENDMRSKLRLLEIQRDKPLKAFTVQVEPTYKCRLFDRDSNDVGEILINEGLAIAVPN